MATMNDIEQSTKDFADRYGALSEIVAELNDAIEAEKRKRLAVIKRRVAAVAEAQSELKAKIEESPELFVKPRTVVMHGVRVGLQKGKGRIDFDDDDQVVRLIRKHAPDMAEVLIITTEKPSRDGLSQLDVATLKKLGCIVEEAGDQVVIKPTDSNVDKLVKALLKGATEEEAQS